MVSMEQEKQLVVPVSLTVDEWRLIIANFDYAAFFGVKTSDKSEDLKNKIGTIVMDAVEKFRNEQK
jgi:hypothetical protein